MWNHIISRVCFPNFHVSSVGFFKSYEVICIIPPFRQSGLPHRRVALLLTDTLPYIIFVLYKNTYQIPFTYESLF